MKALGKVVDWLRFGHSLNYASIKLMFEKAIGEEIHIADFDDLQSAIDDQDIWS